MGKNSNELAKTDKLSHTKDRCRICGKNKLINYIDLGEFPMPNNLFKSKEEALKAIKFPLKVNFCNYCKMSQLSEVVDGRVMFSHYTYRSDMSKTFISHCRDMAKSFKNKYTLIPGSSADFIIDIASNTCTLLEEFRSEIPGLRVLGIDPAKNLCDICREKGIPTISEFLNINVAMEALLTYGKAQLITAQNVTAHLDDLRNFFLSAKFMLAYNGVFVIEFPYLVDTIENVSYGQIYHEHMSYFLVTPLKRLCDETGMKIISVEKFDIHDGSLRVAMTHDYSNRDVESSVEEFLNKENELGYLDIYVYDNFTEKVKSNLSDLNYQIKNLNSQGFKVGGFAASAKGNTMLNAATLDYRDIMYIVDDTPEKQNMYSPGTGIPIVDVNKLKETPVDYILILAPNFTKEIKQRLKGIYNGKYIIPVPKVKIEK